VRSLPVGKLETRFARCRFNGHFKKESKMSKAKTATKPAQAATAPVEATALSTIQSAAPVAFDPSKLKVKRQVVLPLLSMHDGDKVFVKFNKAFYTGKVIEGATIKKAADLCEVTDITTGQIMTMIVSKVLFSTMSEEYPKDSYVGKIFALERIAPKEGKKYPTFGVVEVELSE
jgi:hypothetical protein